MNRRLLIALGIAGLVALGGVATDASAACSPVKDFYTLDVNSGTYRFLVWPPDATEANIDPAGGIVKGAFWQGGNLAGGSSGPNCPPNAYILADPPGVLGQAGGDIIGATCDNLGCPVGSMVLLIQTLSNDGQKAYYAVGKTAEIDGRFDFARGPSVDWNFVEIPRPRVLLSTRVAPNVNVDLSFAAPDGARGETDGVPANAIVTGYQIVRFTGPNSGTEPGRLAAAWTPVETLSVTPTGATRVQLPVDCSNPGNDVWLATRLILDGGQYSSDYVSASTRIQCRTDLAEPKFKMIEKPKPGRQGAQTR